MNIYEFMSPEWVELDFSAVDKEDLLEKMVAVIAERGLIDDSEAVVSSLLEREHLMSTGIKKGYAIPHAFTNQLDKSLIFFVRLDEGIEYQSLDGEPVQIVFLLLGPPNFQGIHLKILARLARLLSLSHLFKLLVDAQTPADVISIIGHEEANFNLDKAKMEEHKDQ
jgi:fructose-specific phosphotransferase system IIA component